MMEPPPALSITGIWWRMARNTPVASTPMVRCQSSTVCSCSGAVGGRTPALLKAMSMVPCFSTAVSIRFCTEASSVTSVRTNSAVPPASVMICTVSSARSSMSPTTTVAPALANSTAVARPIPVAPPVMTTILSLTIE